MATETFYGEIIEVDESSVLVDTLIDVATKKFEVRRFDIRPLQGVVDLKEGAFLSVQIATEPGSISFRFGRVRKYMQASVKEWFSKDDYFKGIDESRFRGE